MVSPFRIERAHERSSERATDRRKTTAIRDRSSEAARNGAAGRLIRLNCRHPYTGSFSPNSHTKRVRSPACPLPDVIARNHVASPASQACAEADFQRHATKVGFDVLCEADHASRVRNGLRKRLVKKRTSAEGATAPETLRQKDRRSMTLWKAMKR